MWYIFIVLLWVVSLVTEPFSLVLLTILIGISATRATPASPLPFYRDSYIAPRPGNFAIFLTTGAWCQLPFKVPFPRKQHCSLR
jgi:hypothetical protein